VTAPPRATLAATENRPKALDAPCRTATAPGPRALVIAGVQRIEPERSQCVEGGDDLADERGDGVLGGLHPAEDVAEADAEG
jgi:hypothetical protein